MSLRIAVTLAISFVSISLSAGTPCPLSAVDILRDWNFPKVSIDSRGSSKCVLTCFAMSFFSLVSTTPPPERTSGSYTSSAFLLERLDEIWSFVGASCMKRPDGLPSMPLALPISYFCVKMSILLTDPTANSNSSLNAPLPMASYYEKA